MKLDERIQRAIEVIKLFEPEEGYWLAFSGGKDSTVVYHLLKMAGVKFEAHHSLTTADAPDTIKFIREHYPDVQIDKPKHTMWELIIMKKFPPSAKRRYCCETQKEGGGVGRLVVTGVRRLESVGRRNRKEIEFDVRGSNAWYARERRELFNDYDDNMKAELIKSCPIKGKTMFHPIVEWNDFDVWEFIEKYNLPYCKLYDMGFPRAGCLICPMQSQASFLKYLEIYPQYKQILIHTFDKMLEARLAANMLTTWKTGEEVFEWYVSCMGKGGSK